MKKLVALILIACCVFALSSCQLLEKVGISGDLLDKIGIGGNNNNNENDAVSVEKFVTALAAAPVSAKVDVKLESELATLEGEYNVTYADGVATVEYTYDKLNSFVNGVAPETVTSEVTGTAVVDASGAVTSGTLGAHVAKVIAHKINLDTSKMTYNVGGGVLSATVTKGNSAAVLGFEAPADVTVNISVSADGVASISLAYDTAEGPMTVSCVFTY